MSAGSSLPSAGFEPAISGLKARRPLRRHHEGVGQCVGQELNLHSPQAGGLQPLGFANTQPTHYTVAQEGLEPSAFLFLREDGLPIAYRATPVACAPGLFRLFGELESNQHRLVQSETAYL